MKKNFLDSKLIKRKLILFYSLALIFQMSFFSALPVANYAAASDCQTGLNIEAQTEFRGQTSLGCINPWDKSSLEFASCCQATCEKVTARICNYGNGNMISSSSYEVWYSATGNPKFGSFVATGTIPVLGQGQCTDLEYIPTVVGNYKFKAYQQFGHFGVGYLWSDNCGVISFDGCIQPYCGDGTVNNGEECDDGNTIGDDGCSANCTVEQTGPYCGDGIKNGTEECDGNDGVGEHQACSVNCTLNNLPYCGDGIKNNGEECDGSDGVGENQICSDTCTITEFPYCGDGIINGDEECDDANTNSEDACQNNCTLPTVCESNLDVMMVLDRSGSMGDSSRCDWWQLKCNNRPVCTSYTWVLNTDYNKSKSWCDAKSQSFPHNSVWTDLTPTKISVAKETANNFLSLMGTGDQSGLVSFANSATLDKTLSNNHAQTQTAINNLIPYGATNIGDAIKLANGELTSIRINASATQIMILLTDGKANKPSGSGYGEYGPDVAYALAQANEAAVAGIKIFTIGLGADINADMLQQIASTTGGKYYFSPTAQDLDDIFAQISTGVCQNLVRISSPYQVSSYGNIAIVLPKYLI